jgi:hypothetical protein
MTRPEPDEPLDFDLKTVDERGLVEGRADLGERSGHGRARPDARGFCGAPRAHAVSLPARPGRAGRTLGLRHEKPIFALPDRKNGVTATRARKLRKRG